MSEKRPETTTHGFEEEPTRADTSSVTEALRKTMRASTSEEWKKRMTGRERWDLLPFSALKQVVKVLTIGAEKYDEFGWRQIAAKPEGHNIFFNKAIRHLVAWKEGEEKDAETGVNHLAHVIANCLFLLHGRE